MLICTTCTFPCRRCRRAQVGVFSATLPPEALEITRKFMSKPVRILVKRDELTLEGIKQFYVNVVSRGRGQKCSIVGILL